MRKIEKMLQNSGDRFSLDHMGRENSHIRYCILLCLGVFVLLLSHVGSINAQYGAGDDLGPPYVISTYPHDGQEGVQTNVRLHVTFSEEMDPGCITSDSFTLRTALGSEEVYGMVSYGNRSATLTLFGHLAEQADYTATVSGYVRDDSGNSMGRDYSWTFTTGME